MMMMMMVMMMMMMMHDDADDDDDDFASPSLRELLAWTWPTPFHCRGPRDRTGQPRSSKCVEADQSNSPATRGFGEWPGTRPRVGSRVGHCFLYG